MKFFCWALILVVVMQQSFVIASKNGSIEIDDFECPAGHFCWPKCCVAGAVFSMDAMTCKKSNDSEELKKQPNVVEMVVSDNHFPILTRFRFPTPMLTANDNSGYKMSEGECKAKLNLKLPKKIVAVNLLSDGRLYVDDGKSVEIFESGFCVENFVDKSKNVSSFSVFICVPFSPVMRLQSPNSQNNSKSNNNNSNKINNNNNKIKINNNNKINKNSKINNNNISNNKVNNNNNNNSTTTTTTPNTNSSSSPCLADMNQKVLLILIKMISILKIYLPVDIDQ